MASRKLDLSRPVNRSSGRWRILGYAICVAVLPAMVVGCVSAPATLPGHPAEGQTVLVLLDGYYYPAVRVGSTEIETYPPRIEVMMIGSGETKTPFVTSVVAVEDAQARSWRAQTFAGGVWEAIGADDQTTSPAALIGSGADLSEIRFEKFDVSGAEQ